MSSQLECDVPYCELQTIVTPKLFGCAPTLGCLPSTLWRQESAVLRHQLQVPRFARDDNFRRVTMLCNSRVEATGYR